MKKPAVGSAGAVRDEARVARNGAPLPRVDTDRLREQVDLPAWLSQHHETVNREDYTRCPNEQAHQHGHDSEPYRNCHVYTDHVFCFACDYSADVFDLAQHLGIARADAGADPFRAAVAHVEAFTGTAAPAARITRPAAPRETKPRDIAKPCTREPVNDRVEARYWQRVDSQLEQPLPPSLEGRGFTPADRATLGLTHGTTPATNHDGFFPTLDPLGRIVTVRRRFAQPGDGPKYKPAPGFGGEQNPAWCSPCIECGDLFIIEGELNGMAAWLALDGQASVMGMNATTGSVWYDPLEGREVYIYGDDGQPGQDAARRWARTAWHAGARRVNTVPAWPDGDACDIAGTIGRAELSVRLS